MSEWKQLWLQYHPVADKGFASYAERVVLEGFEESGVIGSAREELTRGLSGMLGKEPVFVKEAEGACIRLVRGFSLDSGNDFINGEALSDNQKAESYRIQVTPEESGSRQQEKRALFTAFLLCFAPLEPGNPRRKQKRRRFRPIRSAC